MNVYQVCYDIQNEKYFLSENQELYITIKLSDKLTYYVREDDFFPILEENVIQICHYGKYKIIYIEDIIHLDYEIVD